VVAPGAGRGDLGVGGRETPLRVRRRAERRREAAVLGRQVERDRGTRRLLVPRAELRREVGPRGVVHLEMPEARGKARRGEAKAPPWNERHAAETGTRVDGLTRTQPQSTVYAGARRRSGEQQHAIATKQKTEVKKAMVFTRTQLEFSSSFDRWRGVTRRGISSRLLSRERWISELVKQ
jgi:hypothetical protein